MAPVADETSVVLYAASEPAAAEMTDLAPLLADGIELRRVSTAEDVLANLADSACVVVTDTLADTAPLDLLAAIRERDPELPLVMYLRDGSESYASRVSASRATTYLPRRAGPDELADRIGDAVSIYEQRRRHRRDSTILQSLFDQFPYSLYVKDERARYLMATDVLPDASDVRGKTDLERFGGWDPEHASKTYQEDLAVIESGEPVIKRTRERDNRAGEGTSWIETTKVPWYAEGEVRGLVGASLNVTDRKELERELARKRDLHRRITRYIVHDIRNPLNLARGYLENARQEPVLDTFDAIDDALDRIEDVVTDMEIVTGKETVPERDRSPIRLYEVVEDAWNTIDSKDAVLRIEMPEESVIRADESPLQELLENLFRNAVEHGGHDVTVRAGTLPDGFYVADDGRGFSDEIDDVLEPGASTTDAGEGLGLAIVQEIASTYDWELTATESDTGGARFEITGGHLIRRPPPEVHAGPRREIRTNRDVGNATPPGEAERTDGTWVVAGGGRDLRGDVNEHHFAYAAVDGDARVAARVIDLEHVDDNTRAGVMLRAGFDARDPFGFVGTTAGHGSEVLWRLSRDDHTRGDRFDEDAAASYWYRLDRTGDYLTAHISLDGASWTAIDQRRIDCGEAVYAGLAVCSHDAETLSEARFEDVTVASLEPGRPEGT